MVSSEVPTLSDWAKRSLLVCIPFFFVLMYGSIRYAKVP